MVIIRQKYVTVEGEVRNYCHVRKEYKDRNRKPKYPTCKYRLQYLYFYELGCMVHPGFICINCGYIFIDNKYKAFKMRYE